MTSSQNFFKPKASNRRLLDRIEPIQKKMQSVRLFLGIHSFDAELVDFNPSGAGIQLYVEQKLQNEFVQDVLVQGVIDMTGGADSSQLTPVQFHGVVRSVREVKEGKDNIEHGEVCLRLGLQFLSQNHQSAVKVSVPRVVVRLIVGNQPPQPLCVYVDDVFKVNSLVGKIEDLSAFGARVSFEVSSLPLIEKQKIWIEFILPLMGTVRVFAKLAFLRNFAENKWELGLQFIESFGNCSSFIRDWIYLTRRDFTLPELKDAGFDLKEILSQGFGKRVILSQSLAAKKNEISLSDDFGNIIATMKTNLTVSSGAVRQKETLWVELVPVVENAEHLQQLQVLALLRSFSLWASRVRVVNIKSQIPGVEFEGTFAEWCEGKGLSWWAWFFGVRPTLG